MEGFETKDYSPNVEEEIVIDVDTPDKNGDLKEAIHARVKDILKTHINSIYGVYGLALALSNDILERKKKALLESEKSLGLNFEYYRRRVLTNNRLKRMHKPMKRRGER